MRHFRSLEPRCPFQGSRLGRGSPQTIWLLRGVLFGGGVVRPGWKGWEEEFGGLGDREGLEGLAGLGLGLGGLSGLARLSRHLFGCLGDPREAMIYEGVYHGLEGQKGALGVAEDQMNEKEAY